MQTLAPAVRTVHAAIVCREPAAASAFSEACTCAEAWTALLASAVHLLGTPGAAAARCVRVAREGRSKRHGAGVLLHAVQRFEEIAGVKFRADLELLAEKRRAHKHPGPGAAQQPKAAVYCCGHVGLLDAPHQRFGLWRFAARPQPAAPRLPELRQTEAECCSGPRGRQVRLSSAAKKLSASSLS